jgi:hypothetical protein
MASYTPAVQPHTADPVHRHGPPCVPLGGVLTVMGGLGAIAAYFMPWFGSQGALFTGALLYGFLGNAALLRQFMPGLGAAQAQQLRALVLLFPIAGGLISLLTLVALARPGRVVEALIALVAVVMLVALLGGTSQLPPGASYEIGLDVIGVASLVALFGAWLLRRHRAAQHAVPPAGFEPAISALKGLRPRPLDDEGSGSD